MLPAVRAPLEDVLSAMAQQQATPRPEWIAGQRWDLGWLTLSAVLVAIPPLAHTFWRVGATGVDILVTLMIGGPHMYATFLRTVMEPRFRNRHPLLAWFPVFAVPAAVVTASVFAFQGLLSFFFFWASIHICDQASYIAGQYRARGGHYRPWEKWFDFAVVLSSLYTLSIYRFVEGTFVISGYRIFFPEFLKQAWVPRAFAFGTAALLATWVVRSWNQYRAGQIPKPYFYFMGSTIIVGFVVPLFHELSVSFQGFNAWHSFQYLGLTFLALNQGQSAGSVTASFVKQMARPDRFLRYYGWNILLTTGAGVLILGLTMGLKLPTEQCYYSVVLSFLLVHYFHDTVLFSDRVETSLAIV